MDAGPALVSIMRQGPNLIASIHTALDDTEMTRFQRDLIDQVGQHRSRGIIIDVAALDVLDSFGSRTLRNIAEMARLRGAVTVIVGIQPDVAFAIAQGRQENCEDVDPVEQVFSKPTFAHFFGHIAIGGGQKPYADSPFFH